MLHSSNVSSYQQNESLVESPILINEFAVLTEVLRVVCYQLLEVNLVGLCILDEIVDFYVKS